MSIPTIADGGSVYSNRDADLVLVHPELIHKVAGGYRRHLVERFEETRMLEQDWLMASAISVGVLTWDTAKWGWPAFSAAFTAPDRHVLEVAIAYDFDNSPMVSCTHETVYPDGFDGLTNEERARWPSTLVPDPPTELAWLIHLTGLVNDLHARTAALVRSWPR